MVSKSNLEKLRKLAEDFERKDFAPEEVRNTFDNVGGQCMCERADCDGHTGRCSKKLTWGKRGGWSDSDAWQVDHKNGDSSDNRLANCQVLCSECHKSKTAAQS